MATALQQQLAVISASSTDQLNLKAQKTRHSRSLLFEPREAAAQSFEVIFQLCQEGFAELCQLDRRYVPFSRNLFAENSLTVEREQMTATENNDLNAVIAHFLGLLSGKLLLRPAQKCLEWLVRRWRVHEHNTSSLLYATLPYHGHNLFATVLSILPKELPTNFSFLRPYLASLQCPPRHILVSTAVSNDSFISGYSTFVLEASKRRLQSSILVGSWISILAQSLNIRLDGAQSGREEVRRQRSEDVLLKTLPTMQELLSISDAPDLYLAACMLMTILATKVDLDDKVLDAFMESVATGWTRETTRDGIECLAVLAEEKNDVSITKKVFQAVLRSGEAIAAISATGHKIRTDNLVVSVLDWCIRLARSGATESVEDIAAQLIEPIAAGQASPTLQSKAAQIKNTPELASSTKLQPFLELLAENSSAVDNDVEMLDEDLALLEEQPGQSDTEIFSNVDALPTTTTTPSFLAPLPAVDGLFDKYLTSFNECYMSKKTLDYFLERLTDQAQNAEKCLRELTFLARCWTSAKQHAARRAALQSAVTIVTKNKFAKNADLQVVYPYIITALADTSAQLRRAAAELLAAIASSFKATTQEIWSAKTFYGASSTDVKTLAIPDSRAFATLLEAHLQECILDSNTVRSTIVSFLNDSKSNLSQRSSVSAFLAAHALITPAQEVQLAMLDSLREVGKAASDVRVSIIVPYVRKHGDQPTPRLIAAIKCLSHRSETEFEVLEEVSTTAGVEAYSRIGQLFGHAKPELQRSITDWLLTRALPGNDAAPDGEALRTLREIRLPIESLVHILSSAATKQPNAERPAKRQRLGRTSIDQTGLEGASLDTVLKRASTCLEIVEDALSENRPTTDDQHYDQLVKLLFSILGDIQSWRAATGSELTYLQVLTLNNTLATLKYSNATAIDRSLLRTDMVVETLRSTASPQVHNSALLVISKIATFAPDTVLHSVMPLFTFMSSSTLRQADAYSVHVINMTIESIVPPLRESLKSKGKDLVAGASDLLLSFTAAFEHVPAHRRQDTFVQLLKVLGPDESLYAVLAMLVERYNEEASLVETLRSIMRSFTVQTQLNALVKYLDLVADACKKRRGLSDSILAFSEKNAAEANASVAALFDGWAQLILSSGLQKKVANELRKDGAQAIQDIYSAFLEKLISLPLSSANAVKFDEPTLKRAHAAALQSLLSLLPTEEFITSSATLMQAGSEQVRVRVFASLTTRVVDARQGDTRLAEIFIECLPNCAVFLSEAQPIAVRKAAIDCVDAISEKFGKRDRDAVSKVIQTVMGSAALSSDNSLLQTASLLCLASTVEVLGEEFVAVAAPILKTALDLASATTSTTTVDARLLDAVFTLFNAILDHEAWLLDAASLGRAIVLATKVRSLSVDAASVGQFCTLAPKTVPLKDLCSSLNATFHGTTEQGSEAVLARAEIVRAAITANNKATVVKQADSLASLMLDLFSLRPADDDDDFTLTEAYNLTLTTALDMVLKLNDLTFRPLFLKVVAWAEADGEDEIRRQIVLFEFAQRLFAQLGSIITAYASYLLDHVGNILSGGREGEEWPQLANAVMQALIANFKSDQDDFWTAPQHFDAVLAPLLDLLVTPVVESGDLINSTVEELAAAVTASPDRLKAINAKIMTALRHEDAAVRLAAVNCERQITARLTFDWLNLLPEMLPYISELLEDDDEAVERAVLSWVKEIEDVTGESLEGMLA